MIEALPLPARDAVVRFLPPVDALRALPFVSEQTLAALQELRMPIGVFKPPSSYSPFSVAAMDWGCSRPESMIEEAVQQAHALRRAWDLGTLKFIGRDDRTPFACARITDVSSLVSCASLHTLKLRHCLRLTDVSPLGRCTALHTLDLKCCIGLIDVSALAGCAMLRTLSLNQTKVRDLSALGGLVELHTLDLGYCTKLTDILPLAGCAKLRTLELMYCYGLTDVSALAGCAALHTLGLYGCDGLTDVSALAGCAALHTLDLRQINVRGTEAATSLDISALGDVAEIAVRGDRFL